ncbi:hypothetical protein CFC21_009503, partial [Triticum aestivum]
WSRRRLALGSPPLTPSRTKHRGHPAPAPVAGLPRSSRTRVTPLARHRLKPSLPPALPRAPPLVARARPLRHPRGPRPAPRLPPRGRRPFRRRPRSRRARGDFLLTHLEHDPAWRLRDFRNGRLLLCRGDSVSVYNPVSISHRHVAVPRPPNGALPEPEYISDCLLDLGGHGDGEGGAPCCFRVVTVQQERDGQRMRAMEYNSCTSGWRVHPWVDVDGIDIGVDVPAKRMRRPMHAAAAGLIFWRYDLNSSLLLDTSTMVFSIVLLPVPRPRVYAIADTDAGACCFLNIVGATMLQVWVLKKKGGGNGRAWELEKQSQIGELASLNRSCDVHMVAAGLAIVYCVSSKYSHIVIDLKDLSLKDKFRCHRCMAFPFQMPWPPAGLVATSTCERSIPQAYACRDAASQHEAPPSSRKRTSNDEMATGKETMEPCIFIASFKNESREKKFCYEIGPPS